MKYFFISLFIFLLFTLSQCKKRHTSPPPDNSYGLPNATQTGADMFACRINGQNWISKTDIYNLGASIANDTLRFFGGSGGLQADLIIFFIKDQQQGQTYLLNQPGVSLGSSFMAADPCLQRTIAENSISGALTLTKYDIAHKIVSGTFNCVIPIPQCDTLKITDGRFDIQYHY